MSDRLHDWPRRLELDPSVFLAAGAIVTGEVKIGARSSVWYHTVLRGDTDRIVIGSHTNLQDLTLVHVDHGQPAIVGDRVTVGHRAILHGCVIGDDCLIGMGAILLSGAKIGAGSLIAAGALVREGQEIPPGSLAVGAPARVIGPVAEAHRAAIRDGATHYAELSREYLARGLGQSLPARDDARGSTGVLPPAMEHGEWERLFAVIEGSPAVAESLLAKHGSEAFARRPGPDRWSAAEVVDHLIDADVEIFATRLERLLTESRPEFAVADLVSRRKGGAGPSDAPARLIARWREARSRVLGRLAGCGPAEWERRGTHALRGPYSIADMARAWGEHDLSHLGQMRRALGESR